MNSAPQAVEEHRIGMIDWIMLLLAIVSVALLCWETFWDLPAQTTRWIIRIDIAICAIFAVEFLWRWRGAGWQWRYVQRNWYEIIGMIPLSEPALRGFRLFRILRILVLLSRFGRAADRAFGDEFFYRLVNRFSSAIVEAIKAPITAGVLGEVAAVMSKGHYSQNIARALLENEREIEAMIAEKLREDPQAGLLARLPFYDEIVRAVTRAGFRVVLEVLRDPRTDELVADMLRENLMQLRRAVLQHEAELHAERRQTDVRGAT
ncbi:ion transporter [Sinimarinibacterium thermocellulolyticum]|uniref:Ion transporter n=1 Tax=Sinimarinibacterium thermocellulolyticum TaxID=3170016 RepID=A0ABV2A8A3_9GAMM